MSCGAAVAEPLQMVSTDFKKPGWIHDVFETARKVGLEDDGTWSASPARKDFNRRLAWLSYLQSMSPS